ncbi:MAG: hypothetical protein GX087_12080 [Desulfobulbaceae bacterium]|nr:hypothetical protein [Desulfobulbaceae bacterium]
MEGSPPRASDLGKRRAFLLFQAVLLQPMNTQKKAKAFDKAEWLYLPTLTLASEAPAVKKALGYVGRVLTEKDIVNPQDIVEFPPTKEIKTVTKPATVPTCFE